MGNGIRYYDLLPVVNKRIIANVLIEPVDYFREADLNEAAAAADAFACG
jgi:hypothetical protein